MSTFLGSYAIEEDSIQIVTSAGNLVLLDEGSEEQIVPIKGCGFTTEHAGFYFLTKDKRGEVR
mgnify:CR=1 FL=1